MRVSVSRRAYRVAVAAVLACLVQAGAQAAPDAPYVPAHASSLWGPAAAPRPTAAFAHAGGGLDVLAPALPMPVKPSRNVDVTAELPPCQAAPMALASEGAAASEQNAPDAPQTPAAGTEPSSPAATASPGSPPSPESPEPLSSAVSGRASSTAAAAPSTDTGQYDAQLDCAVVPTSAADNTDALSPSLYYIPPAPGARAAVTWGRPVGAPKPWFSGVSTEEGVVLGDRNLTYRSLDGPSVSLGSLTPFTPGWSTAAPIGGLQVSNLTAPSNATVAEGKLGYSSVWGRINNTDPGETAGGVQYGAPAGTSSLRYGLTPDMTLEGQVQSARALNATGLGTTYSMGQWGTLQGGATQSRFDTSEGWRYRLGYNVDVFDSLTLGYANELTSSGYGDLSTYQDGAINGRQLRNTFSAGVPITGWGTLSGTYSGLRDTSGELLERRYGVTQSMMLSPNVRFAVGADRDVVSGDYAVNMQLTMPIGGR